MTALRGLWLLGLSFAMIAIVQDRAHGQPPKSTPPTFVPSEVTARKAEANLAPDSKTAPPGSLPVEQKSATPPPAPSPSSSTASEKIVHAPAGASNQLSAALLSGPGLYETGRVGKMGLSEAGVQIRQTHNRAAPQEQRVQRIQPKTELASQTQPRVRPGIIEPGVLGREIKSRFALLRDCKTEVARQKKIAPSAITASRLTLRWTILTGGAVADTQVVATSRVDGAVMNCVKREMSQWSFTSPTGGPVRVERPFTFGVAGS